jgi:hypothetical protein
MNKQRNPMSLSEADAADVYFGSAAYRQHLSLLSALMGDALWISPTTNRIAAFLIEAVGPLDGNPAGLLVDVVAEQELSASDYAVVIDAIRDHANSRGWSGVTASLFPHEAQQLNPPLERVTSRVRKRVNPAQTKLHCEPLVITKAEPEDLPICRTMLMDALRHGSSFWTLRYKRDDLLEAFSGRLLDRGADTSSLHLVARLQDQIVGHAIGTLNDTCMRTGIKDSELLDAYTMPLWRQRGFSAALASQWEQEAMKLGALTLRGAVTGARRTHILRQLRQGGWREYALEWELVDCR